RDDTVKLMLNFLFSMPFVTAVYLLFAGASVPDYRGLAGAVYIGLFEMGVTFVLWLKALSLFETTAQAGSLVYLSRFLSLLLIRVLVKERIHPSTIVGLVLIIAGIYTLHGKPIEK
ncbi:MAG: EamA/RhaT family transporter, partial [Thermoproteota archaeon]